MTDLFEDLTDGNLVEVKVVLTTVVAALALYQVALISVAYGKVRPSFLSWASASISHRTLGDAVIAVTALVGLACLVEYGFEDEDGAMTHAVLGAILLGVIAIKVGVVRIGGRVGRLLPVLGLGVLALYALTWVFSAGDRLAEL